MKILLTVFILAALLLALTPTFSQEAIFKSNPAFELTQKGSQITNMTQDPQGYIWFGTDQGLYRYNGFETMLYLMTDNIRASNFIRRVYADDQGLIWCGSLFSGLDCLVPKTGVFKHFKSNQKDPTRISSNMINDIIKDKKGFLWVATSKGLNRLDIRTGKNTRFQEDKKVPLTSNQEKINHPGKRASNIVKGMLEHSRTRTSERELTDINALVDEYLRLSYHGMRAKDKSFNAVYKTAFDENLPQIEIVSQDIGRVLLNLFNNAFYAVQERNLRGFENLEGLNTYTPSVIVSTQRADNQIILSVKDNGNGIPENIKAKIFQPFFTTKPTGEGTGLGLSLAYDIVTKGHGGSLEVDSTEGVGTEFIIQLPFKTNG